MTIMQCVFHGPPRSGKTSLMKRMVGEHVTPSSPSTGVANTVMQVRIRRSAVNVFGSKWDQLTHNQEAAHHIMNIAENQLGQVDDSEILSQTSVVSQFLTSIVSIATYIYTSMVTYISTFDAINLKPSIDFCKITLQNAESILQERGWMVYLTDTGGQIEFQELLPLLVSGPSVFFLVFRLDHDLNKQFTVEYHHVNGKTSKPYLSVFTVKEALLQSLATIDSMVTYTYRGGKNVSLKPHVFFVGTHRDMVSQKTINDIDLALRKMVEPTRLYREGMIQRGTESHMLLAVNNLSHKDSGIQQVRDAIERLGKRGDFNITAPPSWLIFGLRIREQKNQILSYKQCFEIAKQCGITKQEELNAALWFLHTKVGLIRHFQGEKIEDLQEIVIQDPQVLFDKITDLVVETFTFEKTDPIVQDDFMKKGIFPFSTLNRITESPGSLLTPKLLVKLLEHLHIIAPLKEEGEEMRYFMPCILKHAKPEETTAGGLSPQQPSNHPSLLFGFRCGYCPKGVFATLVVHLLSNTKWRLQQDRIFKNYIVFTVPPYDTVSITMHPKFLEITCSPASSEISRSHHIPLAKSCDNVKHSIERGIEKVTEVLHYLNDAYLAFYCPGTNTGGSPIKPYLGEINFDGVVPHTISCDGGISNLPIGYERWFPEVCTECQLQDVISHCRVA